MFEPPDDPRPAFETPMPDETTPGQKAGSAVGAWLAWIVILGASIGMMVLPGTSESATAEEGAEELSLVMSGIQGRYIIGVDSFMPNPMLYQQARSELDRGSVAQRQRFVVLAGELEGPDEAQTRLEVLNSEIALVEAEDASFELTDEQRDVQHVLGMLYGSGGDPTALSASDRIVLRDELGWFGDLALVPAPSPERDAVLAPAKRTVAIVVGMVGGLGFAGFLGFIGLIVVAVLMYMGRIGRAMRTDQPRHTVYAETFAVWLLLFLALQLGFGGLVASWPGAVHAAGLAAFFLSLLALVWPVLRGIPWPQVREDIGLTRGRGLPAEAGVAVAGYAMALPVVALGLLITVILMAIQGTFTVGAADPSGAPSFEPMGGPAHPIILSMTEGGLGTYLFVVALGSLAAPIVEETFFRGVLYAHLRNGTRGLGVWGSVLLSVALSSFIFAAIHPQGWVAIPALASLAACFALVREWRGTIVPCMIMHGLSNFIVLTLVFNLLST